MMQQLSPEARRRLIVFTVAASVAFAVGAPLCFSTEEDARCWCLVEQVGIALVVGVLVAIAPSASKRD